MRYSNKEKFLSFWELCPRPLTRGSAPGPPITQPQYHLIPPNLDVWIKLVKARWHLSERLQQFDDNLTFNDLSSY